MPKISSYPTDTSPDQAFLFIGTDPSNQTEASSGSTEKVPLSDLSAVILANAALTGVPTAPTAAESTNTTQVASTAFVTAAVAAGGGGGGGAVPGMQVIWMDALGADHTGTTSCTTIFDTALTEADGNPCVFVFGVGEFLFSTAPASLTKDQSVIGWGSRSTTFNWSGTGPLFTVTETVGGDWDGSDNAGAFVGFSINGPYGSTASAGIKYGALQGIRIDDVGFYGLPSGAVIGYAVEADTDWAEEGQLTRLDISECGAVSGFVFSFVGTSFDYTRIDALVVVEPNIDILSIAGGAEMQGLELHLRGNLHGGTANTGAIISMDRASSSTASVLGGGNFSVSMEADDASAGGTGDVGHYILYMNSTSAASQFQASGTLFAYNEGSCVSQGYYANPDGSPVMAFSGWTNALDGTAPAQGAALTVMGALLQTSGGDGFGTFYGNNVYWEFGNVQTATLGATQTLTFDSPGTFIMQGTLYLKEPASGSCAVTWPATVTWIGTAPAFGTSSGRVWKILCDYLPTEGKWYCQNAGVS